MPRISRRTHRRRTALTIGDIDLLLTGRDWFADTLGPINNPNKAFDECAARDGWESMRQELMAYWISQFPGTRCWAWWRFSCPTPRYADERQVDFLDRLGLLEESERDRLAADPTIYNDHPQPPLLRAWPPDDAPAPTPPPSDPDDPGPDDDLDDDAVGHA